jgi:chromosome segregation ATPase
MSAIMEKEEQMRYKLYKNEMRIVFKAEKITGSLSFLEKFKELTQYFPQIQDYIDGINDLNIKLYPEIETMMAKIQSDIDRIKKELEIEKEYIKEIEEEIKPYNEKLNEILKGKYSEEIKVLTQSFKDENPEYAELDEKKEKLEDRLKTLRTDIIGRANLFNRLSDCIGRIESHFAA